MGQIFNVVVYDIKKRKCYTEDADKFHANCYSYSGTVVNTHYLLRKGPFHVMWCGGYVLIDDNIEKFLTIEKLLGISVVEDYESFEYNTDNLLNKPYYEKIKFIEKKHHRWKKFDPWEKASKYFDYNNTKSVKYENYLINHTKKQAIDLKEYYKRSISLYENGMAFLIDLIPCLTETGGGTEMALFDGCTTDSSTELVGKWCGDLLEIVEEYPKDYKKIDCCFAKIWERPRYCFEKFGTDEKDFILKDKRKNRLEVASLNYFLEQGPPYYIKRIKTNDDSIIYKPIPTKDVENEEKDNNDDNKNDNKNDNNDGSKTAKKRKIKKNKDKNDNKNNSKKDSKKGNNNDHKNDNNDGSKTAKKRKLKKDEDGNDNNDGSGSKTAKKRKIKKNKDKNEKKKKNKKKIK